MTERDAIELIQGGIPQENQASAWADLGCGSGTFTKALAAKLFAGSTITALDRESQKITSLNNDVTIMFQQADFTSMALPEHLDGIIIANALHYVNNQSDFLRKVISSLKAEGRIIIIEYDTDRSNPWVPYPLTFQMLQRLLLQAGFKSADKIGEKESIYSGNKMYACLALK